MPLLPNRLQEKGSAGEVFGGNRAQAQAAEVAAPGQLYLLDYLGPGIDGVAAEARRRVRAGVDGGELHGAAETVERKRPRQRDHVATVDDAPAEAALSLGMLGEVHARRVLVEARRHLMLRLLDGQEIGRATWRARVCQYG